MSSASRKRALKRLKFEAERFSESPTSKAIRRRARMEYHEREAEEEKEEDLHAAEPRLPKHQTKKRKIPVPIVARPWNTAEYRKAAIRNSTYLLDRVLRCHCRGDDPNDSDTHVWCAEAHPTKSLVATAGGSSVCIVNCSTGMVESRYVHEVSPPEDFETVAWSLIPAAKDSPSHLDIVAAAGSRGTIKLINVTHSIMYYIIKGVCAGSEDSIVSLKFCPAQPTWLLVGTTDGHIHLYDIKRPSMNASQRVTEHPQHLATFDSGKLSRISALAFDPEDGGRFYSGHATSSVGEGMASGRIFRWTIPHVEDPNAMLDKVSDSGRLKLRCDHQLEGLVGVGDVDSIICLPGGVLVLRIVSLAHMMVVGVQKNFRIFKVAKLLCPTLENEFMFHVSPNADYTQLYCPTRKGEILVYSLKVDEYIHGIAKQRRLDDEGASEVLECKKHCPPQRHVTATTSGNYIISGGNENKIFIWRRKEWKSIDATSCAELVVESDSSSGDGTPTCREHDARESIALSPDEVVIISNEDGC